MPITNFNYKKWFLIFLLIVSVNCFAQKDSAYVLLITKKGAPIKPDKIDYMPGRKGFYLYENCIYDLLLKNDMLYTARVLKIKKDSIVFTTHVDKLTAIYYHQKYDTLTISPKEIKKMKLLSDRYIGLFTNMSMRNLEFKFFKDTLAKRMPIDTLTDTNTTIKYLVMRRLTSQGLDPVYINIDTLNKAKFLADTFATVIAKQDTILHNRNFIWFLPFNANKVNGISLGIHTGNVNGKKLNINGLNANIDLTSLLLLVYLFPHFADAANAKMLSDSLDNNGLVSINGLSVSGGGVMYGKKLSGLFISGGFCESNNANGFFITGGYNYFQTIKGISIGGIRNMAVNCRGVQIGLVNVCKHLKGLQIGLWNVNGKRKLPFINWGK